MFQYIIQTVAFQLFFLMVYDFLLKKETFFNWNRAYLLGTAVLSLLIPLIKIESFKHVVSPDYIITLPEVFLGHAQQDAGAVLSDPAVVSQSAFRSWEMIFFMGVAVAMLLFGFKLFKMFRMFVKNPKRKVNNFHIVKLLNSSAAFSFFKYIFLGELINETDKEAILKHEKVHVRQRHSLDMLLFEILRIFFWFNPLIYMYQNRMVALHEFIADAHTVNPDNKKVYYQNLLSQVFDTKAISFINPFFKQSLIKKRILMLTKSKSKQINLLKYAILIPIVTGMLVYSACTVQNELTNLGADLSEYTYVLRSNTGNFEISDDIMNKHQKYQAFLKTHPEYVGKVFLDKEAGTITYSIHSREEKMPDDFMKVTENLPDGSSYDSYINFSRNVNVNQSNDATTATYLDKTDVPFAVIDQVPVYPGCEDLPNEEKRACMSKNIAMFVNKNFNTTMAKNLGLVGRQRINVIFKIDKEGNVTGVRSRAPHPDLEEEAKRVINALPKMIPGEHNGETVNVPYSLPIIFQVADVPTNKE
ncbi:M56 family metallopeptidase [Seonamhaeicola sp.]|uniref:M56 family metallopeptidase n=1 Tax=Seonamhaeicola sp. TaxID=1912245 RepID=UPI00261D7BD0|nr:M56 family metallopeptidase [Seonamhaeicola sp.]